VIGKPYRSYVAIGDSLSEGLGDFTFHQSRYHSGWTDRLAAMLAKELEPAGHEFHYANLALRGSKLSKIIEVQLPAALRLQPDLVTVMAGSNDLMSKTEDLPGLRSQLRSGVEQLLAAGCDVVLANTINPLHLKVFKPLRHRAELFSILIDTVADEFDIPVLDVYGIEDFSELAYWAEDMVHFSGYGHIKVANQAAEILGLSHKFPLPHLQPVSRGVAETLRWIGRDVIPFFERRVKGKTSGDGMLPKHLELGPYSYRADHPNWELISA
jgi:lysophospholipase L1-like esterase